LFDVSSPSKIYTTILSEVDKLLLSFKNPAKDEELEIAWKSAKQNLSVSRQEILDSLSELEKNAEWDVFTIAFYGETNAGKSTLIETLRILLAEPGKAKERQEFSRKVEEYGKIQAAITKTHQNMDSVTNKYKDKFNDIDNQLKNISLQLQKNAEEIQSLKNEVDKLNSAAQLEKKGSVANFFKYLFRKLPSQKALKNTLKEIAEKESGIVIVNGQQNELLQSKEKLNDELNGQVNEIKEKQEQLNNEASLLSTQIKAHNDGQIIGDGRSDFTRDVTSYRFEAKGQKFALLDLPGIEGNESLVLGNINVAVQKAHAVFYVTSKSTPPQTGDKGTEGTLQKIKKHLGHQTEVFTVFNKRVKNPNSLNERLVDEDEAGGLQALDKIMHSHLGKQYGSTYSLSAYPAFLAVANCWQNDFASKKEKFIGHFASPQTLIDRAKVQAFSAWLTTDVVSNCKAKIKKSNLMKTVGVLNRTVAGIHEIIKQSAKAHKDIVEREKSTRIQLDDAKKIFKKRLKAATNTAIQNFKNDARNKIYEDIKQEMNDSDFKDALEKYIKEGIENLQSSLEEEVNRIIDIFKEDVYDIMTKHQKDAEELLALYSKTGKFDKKFELNIDIKSGINWFEHLMSFSGSAVGMIVALKAVLFVKILVVIGLVVVVAKFIYDLFRSAESRKAQQRKSADENIEKIGQTALESINSNLAEAYKSLDTGIGDIKEELAKTHDRIIEVNKILANAESNLTRLAAAIKIEGEK